MKVTLRSDDTPDVMIEANEWVRLQKLDQHIRTLVTARRWLRKEIMLKNERDRLAAKNNPKPAVVAKTAV